VGHIQPLLMGKKIAKKVKIKIKIKIKWGFWN
jgi:hypothetical protein